MVVKCVIFDMDGLMFDTEMISCKYFIKVAKEFGYDLERDFYASLCGGGREENYRILKEHFDQDYPAAKIRELVHELKDNEIKKDGLPIKAGLIELLKYLKDNHILVAVASSSSYHLIIEYLTMTNTNKYIDYIISGDQVTKTKPDPEIFLNVCNHFDILPSETLVLEDSRNGIMAAVNGNIPVICVPDLLVHDKDIMDLTYKTVNNLKDVIEVIKV